MPPEIYARPKMGFGVPVAAWLRGDWREPAADLLLDGRMTADGWFRRDRLEAMLQAHLNNQADHSYPIFALMVFELWLSQQNDK